MRTLLAVLLSVLFLATTSISMAEEAPSPAPAAASPLRLTQKLGLGTLATAIGFLDLALLRAAGPSAGGVIGFLASAGMGFLLLLSALPVLLLWLVMRSANQGEASARGAATRAASSSTAPGSPGGGQTR